jgi:hypothetical protein
MTAHAGALLVSQIMPIITATVPQVVKPVGSETVEELVQDATATAAKMVESCERRGKQIIPNSIAYYAIQQAKHGRRSYSASRMDALCPSAQLDSAVQVEFMDGEEVECDAGESLSLHELLACHGEDPAQTATRRLDWAELMEEFNERDIAVLQCTVNGGRLDELAARLGIGSARVSQLKREIGKQVKLRWGEDALTIAMHIPAWNGSLKAVRERQACRHERALEARGR